MKDPEPEKSHQHQDRFTILLADDHPLFRKGLEDIVRTTQYSDARFLSAGNGTEAVNLVNAQRVDLAFLDINMPEMNGFDAARSILVKNPATPIIVLTQFDEIPLILNFFKIGVKGFLTKNIEAEEIEVAMTSVLRGDYYYHSRFDETISQWLVTGLRKKVPTIKFTRRELDVVMLMSKGKTTQEISDLLGVSFRSIETYRYQLIRKVDVRNTAELITYVYKNSII